VFKYPVTILLILLIALQTFSKWCLIAEYQVNRDFITKNLCVNRSNPVSCCKGKCYLNKKIATEESQQQAPGRSAQREEVLLQQHTPDKLLSEPVFFATGIDHSTRHLDGVAGDWSFSVYAPPRTISLS
jgi:hypothetical protein